jgi:hypothetical protein
MSGRPGGIHPNFDHSRHGMPMRRLSRNDKGRTKGRCVMAGGILDGLKDPELMARVAERQRVVARIAERMGVTAGQAREMLSQFEADTLTEGCELH